MRLRPTLLAIVIAIVAGLAWWISRPNPPELPSPVAIEAKSNGAIAFECGESWGFNSDLCLVQADGSGLVKLVGGSEVHHPSWSPDGERLLYNLGGGGDSGITGATIWVVNSDGTDREEVVGGGNDYQRFADWSPDGARVVFSRGVTGASGYEGGDDLYFTEVEGSDFARLTNMPEHEFDPDWGPDGQSIIFVGTENGYPDIYRLDLSELTTARLTRSPAAEQTPRWSPDGSMIAFMRDFRDRHVPQELVLIRPDGGEETVIYRCRKKQGCVDMRSVAWSPDGTQLVTVAVTTAAHQGNPGELFVLNADGTGLRQLTTGAAAGCCPTWQPLSG